MKLVFFGGEDRGGGGKVGFFLTVVKNSFFESLVIKVKEDEHFTYRRVKIRKTKFFRNVLNINFASDSL